MTNKNYPENMYLTDSQYRDILLKIKDVLEQENFKPCYYDSTAFGDKYTESNCGLCNNYFTIKEASLFPKEYPERKSMKYRRPNHKCPFDMRREPGLMGYGMSCFYTCYLFKTKSGNHDLILMRTKVYSLLQKIEEVTSSI